MQTIPQVEGPRRASGWKRLAGRGAIALLLVLAVFALLLKDHVRTLSSLERIPGTNAYVMDYYVDYNLDEVRRSGMDVDNVEDALIAVLFPDSLLPVLRGLKSRFIAREVAPIPTGVQRCSAVTLRTADGKMLFGRNLDYYHDACLVLRIHQQGKPTSISVLDLRYLNMDRPDLDRLSLLRRIPLLFAPYYLEDGMNQYGVAVADLSVDDVQTPHDPSKPDIIHSTAMRLILDYASNVDEAVEILRQYNIHFVMETCHLMIADGEGRSVVAEFIDGELKLVENGKHWQVCTNHQLYGTSERQSVEHCDRYETATARLAGSDDTAGFDEVMDVMQAVSKEDWTMWSSVYDLASGEFRFVYRRHFDNQYSDWIERVD